MLTPRNATRCGCHKLHAGDAHCQGGTVARVAYHLR